jgi:hypothetical protein
VSPVSPDFLYAIDDEVVVAARAHPILGRPYHYTFNGMRVTVTERIIRPVDDLPPHLAMMETNPSHRAYAIRLPDGTEVSYVDEEDLRR